MTAHVLITRFLYDVLITRVLITRVLITRVDCTLFAWGWTDLGKRRGSAALHYPSRPEFDSRVEQDYHFGRFQQLISMAESTRPSVGPNQLSNSSAPGER